MAENTIFNKFNNRKKITKIALTGGPCAGKTTAINWINNFFSNIGYRVLFVPEAATSLITGGISPFNISSYNFQNLLMDMQLELERIYEKSTINFPEDNILIVCDRGLMDNKAFLSNLDFNKLIKNYGLTEAEIMDRYDGVFHLVTAAQGAENHYNLNNPARSQNIRESKELDDTLLNCWTGHPHLRIIDNSTNFEEKMKRLIKEILLLLEQTYEFEIEKKYLIEMPDIEILNNLPNCEKLELLQTYVNDSCDEEIRVRKTKINNSYSYLATKKINTIDGKRIKLDRRLTCEEFLTYFRTATSIYHPISKDRYCLTYKNQYFLIDIFPSNEKEAICEINVSDDNKQIELPSFLSVIADVSNNSEYKNINIAKKLVKKK